MSTKKFILATADDYGVYDKIDEAVHIALKEGWLNSVAVLVNARDKHDKPSLAALHKLKKFLTDHQLINTVHVGLHFTMNSGKPVSKGLHRLANKKGFFKSFSLIDNHYNSQDYLAEVEQELDAQLNLFSSVFGTPDHFSSHFDSLTFTKELFELMLTKCHHLPIRSVKFRPKGRRFLYDQSTAISLPTVVEYNRWIRNFEKKSGKKIIMNDSLITNHFTPIMSLLQSYDNQLKNRIRRVQKQVSTFKADKTNTTEILYHLIKHDRLKRSAFNQLYKKDSEQYPGIRISYFKGRVSEFESIAKKRPWEKYADKMVFLPK